MPTSMRRVTTAVLLLLAALLAGVIGYQVIEGWSGFDALYMTIITLATVGYGETHPLSPAGRAFTIGLILLGVGAVTYAVTAITTFVVEGTFTEIIGRKRMDADIAKLTNHMILCGLGETGRHVAEEFLKTRIPFVAIEQDGNRIKHLQAIGSVLAIEGNATEDDVLVQARIQQARGLVTALPHDQDNVFVILTARELNPKLRIVSRAVGPGSSAKLIKAGADAIVSTTSIGGLRMASEMVRPGAVSFLDRMLRAGGEAVRIEGVTVSEGSALAGRTLGEARIREQTGLLVIATARGESYEFNPGSARRLQPGDELIVCCSSAQRQALSQLVLPRSASGNSVDVAAAGHVS